MQYVAFDVEISKEIPEGETDWKSLRPPGISCAATLTSDGESKLWHGIFSGEDNRLAKKMMPIECQALAQYLCEVNAEGYVPVTWNGLGFDFDILAEECQSLVHFDNLRELALSHTDIFFAMLCAKGFGVGLNTANRGMGLLGKTEGMSGAKAPTMWAQGIEEQTKVLKYVTQDVRATAEVYEEILHRGKLHWISRSGRPNDWFVGKRILTVSEALELPEPDTSWMTDPWKREKFAGWTE